MGQWRERREREKDDERVVRYGRLERREEEMGPRPERERERVNQFFHNIIKSLP